MRKYNPKGPRSARLPGTVKPIKEPRLCWACKMKRHYDCISKSCNCEDSYHSQHRNGNLGAHTEEPLDPNRFRLRSTQQYPYVKQRLL